MFVSLNLQASMTVHMRVCVYHTQHNLLHWSPENGHRERINSAVSSSSSGRESHRTEASNIRLSLTGSPSETMEYRRLRQVFVAIQEMELEQRGVCLHQAR